MSQPGSSHPPTTIASAPARWHEVEGNTHAMQPNGSGISRHSNKRDSSPNDLGLGQKKAKYDLRTIDAPDAHQKCKTWVVFSDLHVKGDSIETCEKVLNQVYEAAVTRNAGIIFLGDFWHVRRSLEVELLNRVLVILRTWECPVIMIPGNHDQVTLGGTVHSLEPLLYAFPTEQVLMINEPAVCLSALWVPYRRDLDVMRTVLRAGADTPGVSMIFCHADVKGAYMNDNMRSKHGIDITSFPSNIPIYSGHYHKPQTITQGGTELHYVGSPYQTSLTEAGQDKFFYCIQRGNHHDRRVASDFLGSNDAQSETWKEVERWIVDIGPKHIRALSPADPSVGTARPGDRVVVTVPTGQEGAAETLRAELQLRGVRVDLQYEDNPLVRRRKSNAAGGGEADEVGNTVQVEDMDPLRVFDSYMSQLRSNPELEAALASAATDKSLPPGERTAKDELHQKVLDEGRLTLQRLQHTSGTFGGVRGAEKLLRFDTVTLSNFGPYCGDTAVVYPLSDRGLVLLRGKSTDGTGADSNGAGKTTLAMSVLWCLTGSLDARIASDGKCTDVAFDARDVAGKKGLLTAEVIVKGTINSLPFQVKRRRNAQKGDLYFVLNGKDLTAQSALHTQAQINQELGIGGGVLQRCCFFGQHSIQSLLGLTDVKLKQEFSIFVNTALWVKAVKDTRDRVKNIKTELAKLSEEHKLRTRDLDETLEDIERAEQSLRRCENNVADATSRLDSLPVPNDSSVDLSNALVGVQNDQASFVRDVLKPLLAADAAAQKQHEMKRGSIDTQIDRLRLFVTKDETKEGATTKNIESWRRKAACLTSEEGTITNHLQELQARFANDWQCTLPDIMLDDPSISFLSGLCDEALVKVNTVANRIRTVQTSLKRLTELCTSHVGARDEECPTCGQEMSTGSRVTRKQELGASLEILQQKQLSLSERLVGVRNLRDIAILIETEKNKSDDLCKKIAVVRSEIDGYERERVDLSEIVTV